MKWAGRACLDWVSIDQAQKAQSLQRVAGWGTFGWPLLLKCRRIQDDIVEIVRCVYTVDGMSKGFTFIYIDIL